MCLGLGVWGLRLGAVVAALPCCGWVCAPLSFGGRAARSARSWLVGGVNINNINNNLRLYMAPSLALNH